MSPQALEFAAVMLAAVLLENWLWNRHMDQVARAVK